MKTTIEKAKLSIKLLLISWFVVVIGVLLSIFIFNSIAWAIFLIAGYAFQIVGIAYVYFKTKFKLGGKLFYYNIFMCLCLLVIVFLSTGVIPTTDNNDTEYAIMYGCIFLSCLLYLPSIIIISQLHGQLKNK